MDSDSNLVGDQLDVVKRQIYGYWQSASSWRAKIHKQKVQVPDQEEFTYESDFKAAVLELYYACEPKLNYHGNSECVKNIIGLKPVIQPGSKFTLEVAEALFRNLTAFLEENGVTKYETEKYVSKPS